jgi:hypothetical protein
MKKSAEIYLSVLLFTTTAILFLTLAYTLVTGHSPYEAIGIDPALGTIVTLVLVLMLLTVPHLLNHFSLGSGHRKSRYTILRRPKRPSKRPTL